MSLIVLSKENISRLSIFLSIIFGLIAYENNFYSLGLYNLLIVIQLFFVLLAISIRNNLNISIDKYCFIFLLFYYFSFIVSIFFNLDLLSLFRFIIFPLVFIVAIYISGDYYFYFKYFILLNLIPAFLNFIIFFNNGFLYWDLKYGRGTSIYFDPNFCAAILGLCAFLSLIIFKRYGFILFIFFISSMFFTYSKSAIFASALALIVFFGIKFKFYISFFMFVLSTTIIYFLYSMLDLNMFRLEQGMNSRDDLWKFVFDTIFYKGNFLGIGVSNLAQNLSNNGFENASTHNNFMDILLQYGVISFFLIIMLSIYACIIGFYKKNILLIPFVFLLIMSSSITFTVGGLGILSLIYTVIFMSIILDKKVHHNYGA